MTKALLACLVCLASASPSLALGCLLKREQTSGSNKVCFYECPNRRGGDVKAVRSCPLKIER